MQTGKPYSRTPPYGIPIPISGTHVSETLGGPFFLLFGTDGQLRLGLRIAKSAVKLFPSDGGCFANLPTPTRAQNVVVKCKILTNWKEFDLSPQKYAGN